MSQNFTTCIAGKEHARSETLEPKKSGSVELPKGLTVSMFFTIQRNMIFDDFPDLFRYFFWALIFDDLWHRGWLHCGTPFWYQNQCVGVIVFGWFVELIFDWFLIKKGINLMAMVPVFRSLFFNTLVPFTYVRPISARNHFYNLINKYSECIHTCTFYLRITVNCAMFVFTIVKEHLM